MNTQVREVPRASHVIITDPKQCAIHGWTVGNTYQTVDHEIWTPDENGQQIYVQSNVYNRAVQLFTTEYSLPGTGTSQICPPGLTTTTTMVRKHTKTTDPQLTIDERMKLVIGNVLGVHPEDILPAKRFKEDFDADELDLLDLRVSIEEEFDITIPNGLFNELTHVAEVKGCITALVSVEG